MTKSPCPEYTLRWQKTTWESKWEVSDENQEGAIMDLIPFLMAFQRNLSLDPGDQEGRTVR
jgi:hypothetical protein